MIDIKAIKAAAEKATPGEWLASDNGHIYSAALNLLAVAQHCRDKDANAKHIATANPATVSAMCDEIERLTACLKKANDQAEHFEREWYLRGDEIERLRKDAARYQWLVAYFVSDRTDQDDAIVAASEVDVAQVTAVIDAAMGAK